MSNDAFDNSFAEMMSLTYLGRDALASGRFTDARDLLSKKHNLVLASFGRDSVFAATSSVDLAEALIQCAENETARELLAWSIRRYRAFDVNDERQIRALSLSAMAAYHAADYGQAEQEFRALIEDLRDRGAAFSVMRAKEQDHLAQVLARQARYEEAEALLLDSLAILESASEEVAVGTCLGMLASVYFNSNRFREAEAFRRRSLKIHEEIFGEDSAYVAMDLDHIAMALAMRAQVENRRDLAEEAVECGERAERMFSITLPPSHRSVHGARLNLNKYREIHASLGAMYPNRDYSPGTLPSSVPEAHTDTLRSIVEKALDTAMRHDYASAEKLIDGAVDTAMERFGKQSRIAIDAVSAKIGILRRHCSGLLGEPTGLLLPSEHVQMQLRAHARRGLVEDGTEPIEARGDKEFAEACTKIEQGLAASIELLSTLIAEIGVRDYVGDEWIGRDCASDILELAHYARKAGIVAHDTACAIAFAVMQINGPRGTAEAVARALGASTLSPTHTLQREYRDLALKYGAYKNSLTDSALKRSSSNSTLNLSADDVSRIRGRMGELKRLIAESFAFAEESVEQRHTRELASLQDLLNPHECSISYAVASRAVFILTVTKTNKILHRVEFESGLLDTLCRMLQESVVFDEMSDAPGNFDLAAAQQLYDVILHPLEMYLDDIEDLFITPDGPLWSISMESLLRDLDAVVEYLAASDATFSGHELSWSSRAALASAVASAADPCLAVTRANGWVGDRFTVSLLPTAAMLFGRRAERTQRRASRSFLGIGNPMSQKDSRRPESTEKRSESLDLSAPLPETEVLLDDIATFLGADPETDVIVRGDATVQRVVELSRQGMLEDYRVVCFATHATYPTGGGDLLEEPGLVLVDEVSGALTVLSAPTVRELRLNADLVLLTACFTGAPSGRAFNTPLSGLAQAFFAAGAQCLLVSHWPVDVFATATLLREMLSSPTGNDNLISTVCRATKLLRNDNQRRDFCHPVFWAGFSIVGDGVDIHLTSE